MTPSPKAQYNRLVCERIIKAFEPRGIEGYYAENSDKAVELVKGLIGEGASVSWGGSVSLEESGVLAAVKAGKYTLLDRSVCKSAEEIAEMYHKALNCDFFLMSTNAVTMDGQLVNMDGTGNRVAALIYGPKNVIVVAGVNKICPDVDAARQRITLASSINALRLGKKTPCSVTGECGNCLGDGCICSQEVITRRSAVKGRIKVILVGEELGY
jgi:hypothetical protein